MVETLPLILLGGRLWLGRSARGGPPLICAGTAPQRGLARCVNQGHDPQLIGYDPQLELDLFSLECRNVD